MMKVVSAGIRLIVGGINKITSLWPSLSHVAKGVVITVLAAAISALAAWGIDMYQDYKERREQIQYFSAIFMAYRQLMDEAEFARYGDGMSTSADFRRSELYDKMQLEVRIAIARGSTKLTYQEVRQLEVVYEIGYPNPRWVSRENVDGIFDYLESLDWLGLPPRKQSEPHAGENLDLDFLLQHRYCSPTDPTVSWGEHFWPCIMRSAGMVRNA